MTTPQPPRQALITDNWKILREAKTSDRVRLYNLIEDPFEEHDLDSKLPERAEQMREQLWELDPSCQRSRDGADDRY